jgi:hypothetical protein
MRAVGVGVSEVVGPDLVGHRAAQVAEREQHARLLVGREPGEDGPHPVLLERLDLVADPNSVGGGTDDDDPAVVGDPDPFDEASLGHPIDETGRVAERYVEQVGEAAHRELTVVLEDPQNVEVRHADPGFHHPARAGATETADHPMQLVDDGVDDWLGCARRHGS